MPIVVRRGDDSGELAETYAIDLKRIVETFDRVWMPFRCSAKSWVVATFAGRPTGRAPISPSSTNRTRTATTTGWSSRSTPTRWSSWTRRPTWRLAGRHPERPRLLVALAARSDRLVPARGLGQGLVPRRFQGDDRARGPETCRHSPRAPLTPIGAARPDGEAHEHIARYKAFVELIHGLDLLPKFVVVDRSTEPRPVPIDVDLVIDLGNSRTCGLLIEAQPDQLGADITQAVKLQLRDLSRPELVYSEPFDSRLEFSRASFGRDHLSLRSGRAEAFAWPTIVRVGPEATGLRACGAAARARPASRARSATCGTTIPGATAGGSTARRRTASRPGSHRRRLYDAGQ